MVSRFVLTLGVAALVSACAGPSVQAPAPEPAASKEPEVREQTQSQGGASQLLLRAQRIDPRNGAVYLEMARLYATTGATEEARSIAERGLLYCTGSTCEELREVL